MAAPDAFPDLGRRSALSALLRESVIYERAGAVMPRDLVQFGLLGSAVLVLTGVLALIFPSPQSVTNGGFFLVLGGLAGALVGVLKAMAVLAIVLGLVLGGIDGYLLQVPTSDAWRSVVVAQAAAGGFGASLCVVFLALLLLNLAIWIAIIGLVLAVIGVILAAMGS